MAQPMAPPVDLRTQFNQMCSDNELRPDVADDLFGVLTTSRVVLLLDDSGSMRTRVIQPGASAFAPGPVLTRWSELEKLAASIVTIVTATTPAGIDVHFLNRPGATGVTNPAQLGPAFAQPPAGGTPLITALSSLLNKYRGESMTRRVIYVVITDGEPSDGSPDDLFRLLASSRSPNEHVSLAECNDNEEEMAYLDGWDTRLRNFDNTDDFGMELARVRAARGPQFRFTYSDYAVKIILGSVMKKYFNLDQRGVGMGFGGGASSYPQAGAAQPQWGQAAGQQVQQQQPQWGQAMGQQAQPLWQQQQQQQPLWQQPQPQWQQQPQPQWQQQPQPQWQQQPQGQWQQQQPQNQWQPPPQQQWPQQTQQASAPPGLPPPINPSYRG